MPSTATTPGAASPLPRARPRFACQECRRRKLRCDGNQPRCSTCENMGTECDVNTNRPARGPKKGYLKALQSKIDTLESRLEAQQNAMSKWPEHLDTTPDIDIADSITALPFVTLAGFDTPPLTMDVNHFTLVPSPGTGTETEPFLGGFIDTSSSIPGGFVDISSNVPTTTTSTGTSTYMADHAKPPTPQTGCSSRSSVSVTDLVQAELDQLYFDRVHAAIPILHQRRYLSWAKSSTKTNPRICLQYAVWASASLMSAHFQHMQDGLYTEVTKMLTDAVWPSSCHGQNDAPPVDVELVQAWLLTATYEFVKGNRHGASMSASRALRLAQLMGFHRIDSFSGANGSTASSKADLVVAEEKRRAFWMALMLDSLFCLRHQLPLEIHEHNITTFLPVPDADFQSGQHVETGFLRDSIDKPSSVTGKSPLNECILLLATCARTVSHAHQYTAQLVAGSGTRESHVEPPAWLGGALSVRLQALAQNYPPAASSSDPTLLFANCLAQAAVVYLCKEIQAMDWANRVNRSGMGDYIQRAFGAVENAVEVARSLADFPPFKINPFMPIPLFICADFLSVNHATPAAAPLLQSLLEVIGQLKDVETPRTYFSLSELDQAVNASLSL